MEDEIGLDTLATLREMAKNLVDTCFDAGLLDLICKLLL